jgi:hypothetical protein
MELEKDLLMPLKRSIPRFVFGIFVSLFSLTWAVRLTMNPTESNMFNWFSVGIFLLMGLFHLIEASGARISKLFGKAFVIINDEQISIKPGVFDKELLFYWKDIKAIVYETNRYKIINAENSELSLNLLKIEYNLKQEIKTVIQNLANEKKIATS